MMMMDDDVFCFVGICCWYIRMRQKTWSAPVSFGPRAAGPDRMSSV